MTTKNKTAKIVRLLCQSPTKMQGLFNVTQCSRIISKEVSNALECNKKLGRSPESMIKSGLVAQIRQPRSQRHFVLSLQESSIWSSICGFQADVPTQGTFSNNWTNIDYFQPLEQIFLTYQKLIPKKGLFLEFELPTHLLKTVKLGYFPIVTDSSHISLSNRRFKYATRGFKNSDQPTNFGAKLHLCVDVILNTPINFTPTTGKDHESRIFNLHWKDLNQNYKPWLERQLKQKLKMLYLFDKGYWNTERFWNLTEEDTYFICPKKDRTLINKHYEFSFPSKTKNGIIEARINRSGEEASLRWILAKNPKNRSKWYSLVTNIWDIEAEMILRLYAERWAIEEILKWLKQYTLLKTPLVNSWEGFLLHVLFSLLVLVILQYFIALLGLPRWQDNLTEVWRQVRDYPEELWILGRLRIPLAFLNGGID